MDVHQNPAYHSSGLTYIGCFKNTFNDLDRMLFEGTYNNFQNNTPEWCVTYCTAGGYDYAGLQYSSQCICSNSGPQGNSDESQCSYACAGDSSITTCGGLGYINIFHTDAHKSTIDDYGCGSTAQDTYYQRWFEDMGHCNISTTPKAGSAPKAISPADCDKTPTVVTNSNPYPHPTIKKAKNALVDTGSDDNQSEDMWCGVNFGKNIFFSYDIGCEVSISKLLLKNSKNNAGDSGSKDYSVSVSDNEDGPWTVIKNATFDNPRENPIQLETYDLDNAVVGRYVKYECASYYGIRCCLNFIGVQ